MKSLTCSDEYHVRKGKTKEIFHNDLFSEGLQAGKNGANGYKSKLKGLVYKCNEQAWLERKRSTKDNFGDK